MYQFAYDEIMSGSSEEARSQEVMAFERANKLLKAAEVAGSDTPAAKEALAFNEELWMILIEDLAHPENKLPESLRAQLISIGIWMIKEIDRIRKGQSKAYAAMAEINDIVCRGLN